MGSAASIEPHSELRLRFADKLPEDQREGFEAACDDVEAAFAATSAQLAERDAEIQRLKTEKAAYIRESTNRKVQGADAEHEAAMPPALRGFTPISSEEEVRALGKAEGLGAAQVNLLVEPSSAETAAEIERLLEVLFKTISVIVSARLRTVDIVSDCLKVVAAGNKFFKPVYEAVFDTIEATEEAGIRAYQSAITSLSVSSEIAKQRASAFGSLYQDAARVKPLYDDTVNAVVAGLGFKLTKLLLPRSLKGPVRLVEKAALRSDHPGNPDRIFDVVRGMVVASTMEQVAVIVRAFGESPLIEITRVKERFFQRVSAGGWRDCMLNFVLTEDENKHICEVQVCHAKMLSTRAQLDGHAVYNRVRNASELCEAFSSYGNFGLTGEELERAGALSSVPIAQARTMGIGPRTLPVALYEVRPHDLRYSGYTAAECREAGGLTLAELKTARFSTAACKEAGFGPKEMSEAGFDVGSILGAQEAWPAAAEIREQLAGLLGSGAGADLLVSLGVDEEMLEAEGYDFASHHESRTTPEEVDLVISPLDPSVSATLQVHNDGIFPMAFKVKTTHPKSFHVRPNAGLVEAGAFAEVMVIVLDEFKEEMKGELGQSGGRLRLKPKFLIQSTGVTPSFFAKRKEEEDSFTIKGSLVDFAKGKVQNQKLKCFAKLADGYGGEVPSPVKETTAGAEEELALRKKYDDLIKFTTELTAENEALKKRVASE